MKLFYSKYNDAQYWVNTLVLREQKKQLVEGVVETPVTQEYNVQTPVQQEVIFTQEDRGHSEEEAQKIQSLYQKIKGLGFAPSVVGY